AAPNTFTTAEISVIKESFNAVDSNNDGIIPRSELHSLLHTVGHKLNATGLENLLAKYDADKSGSIDFQGFLSLAATLIKNKVASK
ncbi:hypothetical protein EC957_001450, partial [Mortierella hygrophila]